MDPIGPPCLVNEKAPPCEGGAWERGWDMVPLQWFYTIVVKCHITAEFLLGLPDPRGLEDPQAIMAAQLMEEIEFPEGRHIVLEVAKTQVEASKYASA